MSILDEDHIYFSHLWPVPEKHKNHRESRQDFDAEAEQFILRQHKHSAAQWINQQDEDVNAESEDFIRQEHQKFQYRQMDTYESWITVYSCSSFIFSSHM